MTVNIPSQPAILRFAGAPVNERASRDVGFESRCSSHVNTRKFAGKFSRYNFGCCR